MNEEFSDDFEIIDNLEIPDDPDNVRCNEDKIIEDFGLGHNSFGNIKKNVKAKIKDKSNESNDSDDVTEADSTSKPDPFLVNKIKYLQTHTPNSIDQFTKCLIAIAVFAIGFGMGYYVCSSKLIIFRHIEEEFIKDLDERFNHCIGFVDNLRVQLEGINIHLKKQSILGNLTKPSVENEFKAVATGDKQMLKSEAGLENLDKTKLEINLNSAESKNMDIQPSLNINTQNKLSMHDIQSHSSQNSESRKDTHSYCQKKEMKLKAIKYLTIELQRFIRSLTEDSFYKLHHDDVQHYRQEFTQLWKRLTSHKLYKGEYFEFDGCGSKETNENLIDYSWISCQQNWWKLIEESHYINFNSLKKHKTKVFSKLKLRKCISFYEFWQLKVICNIIHLRREIYEQRNIGDDLCSELCETLPMGCWKQMHEKNF